MVAAALLAPAWSSQLAGDAACSGSPAAADWHARAPASPPSTSPTATALLPAAQLCGAGFGMSSGAARDVWEAEATLDGMCGWGEGGESCHSGLPLSVPLPAATEGGRPSAVDCSWGSCSPAEDGSLSPPVSPADSGGAQCAAAAGVHKASPAAGGSFPAATSHSPTAVGLLGGAGDSASSPRHQPEVPRLFASASPRSPLDAGGHSTHCFGDKRQAALSSSAAAAAMAASGPACSPVGPEADGAAASSPDVRLVLVDVPAAAGGLAGTAAGPSPSSSSDSSSDGSDSSDTSDSDSGIRGGFNSHTPEAFNPMEEDALDGGAGADGLQQRLAADGSGFESAFDDDFEPMRYCINCTGVLDADLCMDCGHMLGSDETLFSALPAEDTPPPAAPGSEDLLLIWDERMELHREADEVFGSPHPERPDRLRAVMARLLSSGLADKCRRGRARPATGAEVEACHTGMLRRIVEATASPVTQGIVNFTPDTYTNRHTALAASLAAGASVDAAVAVATGRARAAAAIVRPPGHHAESGMAMGFCFYNNAAIAARAARAAGAERVLVLDWDVHHGNGIQHILEDDPAIMYMSLHRHDGGSFYPGTGAATEVGTGAGVGFNINVAWSGPGMGDADYLAAFHHVLVPIATQFAPDLIIVSAGFDAAEGDPIGGCEVSPAGFAAMTGLLQAVAPLALVLEGGYNLEATAAGVEACLRVALGERPPRLAPEGSAPLPAPSAAGLAAIREALLIQARYWSCLRGLLPPPAPRLPLLHVPAADVVATGFRTALASPTVRDAGPHRESSRDEDMLAAFANGADGWRRGGGGGSAGSTPRANGGISSARGDALSSPRSHPHSRVDFGHSRHGDGQAHQRQHSGHAPGGHASHGNGHSSHHHAGGQGHGSRQGAPAAHGNGGRDEEMAAAPPHSPRHHGAGNGGGRRTKLAFRGSQGRSARRWHLMQQLHRASLKAVKRRREAHAHSATRHASLSLDAEEAASLRGLLGDAASLQPSPRHPHRRHSLGGIGDLEALLASPRDGQADGSS